MPPELLADINEWRFIPMGTVSSSNPGLANLLQTLANLDSPLLSSPSAVSAIEDSSPADIVNLSAQATQLQEVQAIFGSPETTPSDLINGTNTFTALEDALTTPTLSGLSAATPIPTSQLPAYQSSVQAAEADALLNPGSSAGSASSLFSLLG
jgi:hypothetical protein